MTSPQKNKQNDSEGNVVMNEGVSDQHNQYLTFQVNKEKFAVSILRIKEIIEYSQQSITPVPMMPVHVRGVINLRGSVVPIVDLSARFKMGVQASTKRTCIIIVEAVSHDVKTDIGVIVDAVDSVLEIQPANIELPPSFGTNIRTDFIIGMGKSDNGFIILLNVDSVLSVEELSAISSETL